MDEHLRIARMVLRWLRNRHLGRAMTALDAALAAASGEDAARLHGMRHRVRQIHEMVSGVLGGLDDLLGVSDAATPA